VRLQLRRAERGDSARLPLRVNVHRVAAAYGTTPEAVRAWPADDFLDAVAFLGVTSGR
jgi:hypothetical protein